MPDEDLTPDMKQNMRLLNSKGYHLTASEVAIYTLCNEEPRSPAELAKIRKVSRQSVQNHLIRLRSINLIQAAFKIGKTNYWRSTIDLTVSADLRLRFNYKDYPLLYAETMMYLTDPRDIIKTIDYMRQGLAHLYMRTFVRAYPELGYKPTAPTGLEIKAMLINLAREIQRFHTLIEQIIQTEALFTETTSALAQFAQIETKNDILQRFILEESTYFKNSWKDDVAATGFTRTSVLNDMRKIMSKISSDIADQDNGPGPNPNPFEGKGEQE